MTGSRVLRRIAVTAVGALVAGLAVGLTGAPAHAADDCSFYGGDNALAPGEADFDDDGKGDVAYGLPTRNVGGVGGSVVVKQSAKGTVKLSRTSVAGGAPDQTDGFGSVVRAIKVDLDNCTDLAIAAPGAIGGSGRVYVAFGAPGGIGTGRPTVTIQAPNAAAGDSFGAALDVQYGANDDLAMTFLVVGAPGTDVAGQIDAGMVHRFTIDNESRSGSIDVSRKWSWSQGVGGPGEPERGDRFGEVVRAVESSSGIDVVVGVPGEDIGKSADAGIVMIRTTSNKVYTLSQKTKGVIGVPERGDRFGATVAQSGRTLVVGTPGESLGKRSRAGQLHVFTERVNSRNEVIDGSYKARRSLTLDTAKVSGSPRSHDRLGTSLAVLRGLQHSRGLTIAAGMPDRTVGKTGAAGAVALFELTPAKCAKRAPVCGRVVTQSTRGVAGASVTNGRFGASLGVMGEFGPTRLAERRDALVVGAPGGSHGTATNVGVYVQWRPSTSTLVTNPLGLRSGDGFGAIAPARWDGHSLYR